MDLVYILGDGSHWQDQEIKYSLRSAERYFPHGKVFIIGLKPKWLTNVIHIPFADKCNVKTGNGVAKIMRAARDNRISESFVLMNDDFFFLKPHNNLPAYYKGTCRELIESHRTKAGYYYETLTATEELLLAKGIENPKDFTVHFPAVFERSKLLQIKELIGKDIERYSIRTLYGNLMGVEATQTEDFKASSLSTFKDYLSTDRAFLSISDAMVKEHEFITWISNKFNKPSIYEIWQTQDDHR